METTFKRKAIQISSFLLHALEDTETFKTSNSGRRRWQLFGIDWMIDNDRSIKFLESNGWPHVTSEPMNPIIWRQMGKIVTYSHFAPEKLLGEERLNQFQETEDNSSKEETNNESDHNKHTKTYDWEILTVKKKYSFGKWELIYNQYEEENQLKDNKYNSCLTLHEFIL